MAEMSGTVFARRIRRLPVRQPLTDAYERSEPRPLGVSPGKTYDDQREHLTGWFSELGGPGYYGRAKPRGARAGYNSFQCAPGLVWLAEALGEDPAVVRKGIAAIEAAPRRGASQCAAWRRVVPWSRIEDLLGA